MTIKKQNNNKKMNIDLRSPYGNAFYLLGIADLLCKKLNKDSISIRNRMISGNYENLITVFDEEFGEYVDLIR